MTSRGIVNLNPGNIRNSDITYQGEVVPSTDPDFKQFQDMLHGIRAIAEILLVYYKVHNLSTIREIINRWAPPSDNNPTDAYINNVADRSGFDPDAELNLTSVNDQAGIVTGIIDQENGGLQGITNDDIMQGIKLVLA